MNTRNSDLKLVEDLAVKYQQTTEEIGNVIVGQHQAVKQILSTIFVGGHGLLIGVPGLAKTLFPVTSAATI